MSREHRLVYRVTGEGEAQALEVEVVGCNYLFVLRVLGLEIRAGNPIS